MIKFLSLSRIGLLLVAASLALGILFFLRFKEDHALTSQVMGVRISAPAFPQNSPTQDQVLHNGVKEVVEEGGLPRKNSFVLEEKETPAIAQFGMPPLAGAKIQRAGIADVIALEALPSGIFPRMNVNEGEKLMIEVQIPGAKPGDSVIVQVEDGGSLEGGAGAGVFKADASERIFFSFEVSRANGIHHVVVSHGGRERVLCFWAGKPLEVSQN